MQNLSTFITACLSNILETKAIVLFCKYLLLLCNFVYQQQHSVFCLIFIRYKINACYLLPCQDLNTLITITNTLLHSLVVNRIFLMFTSKPLQKFVADFFDSYIRDQILILESIVPTKSTQVDFFFCSKCFKIYPEVMSERAACLVCKLKYLEKIIPILY